MTSRYIKNSALPDWQNFEYPGSSLVIEARHPDEGGWIAGGKGNDLLIGSNKDDTLFGNYGADTMIGGAGNDTYDVDNPKDVIRDTSGIDTVSTTLNYYRLSDDLENLKFRGDDETAFTGWGNDRSNLIDGGMSSDTIYGLGGDDRLNGFWGDDVLHGGDGNDALDGGTGWDRMFGGTGDDTYFVDSYGDYVEETAGSFYISDGLFGLERVPLSGGIDHIKTTLPTYSIEHQKSIEHLTYLGNSSFEGSGNDGWNRLTGGSGSDTLYGLGGDDYLDGGTGADRLIGGRGSDEYLVDHPADIVVEWADDDGVDKVMTTLSYYQLTANVENLELNGSGIAIGIGNDSDNKIEVFGADGGILEGRGGDDSLIGRFDTADTARFTGSRSEYEFTVNDDGTIQVKDKIEGRDGIDTLTDIDRLEFADGVMGSEELAAGANAQGFAAAQTIAALDNASNDNPPLNTVEAEAAEPDSSQQGETLLVDPALTDASESYVAGQVDDGMVIADAATAPITAEPSELTTVGSDQITDATQAIEADGVAEAAVPSTIDPETLVGVLYEPSFLFSESDQFPDTFGDPINLDFATTQEPTFDLDLSLAFNSGVVACQTVFGSTEVISVNTFAEVEMQNPFVW